MFELVDVTAENLEKTGFFCYMSKRHSEGYRRKLEWVKRRLREGMRIRILQGGSRGFIEYIPGESGWRAVDARGYLLIHCLWIVGKKNKNQNHGSFLVKQAIEDAREAGKHGVAAVTSDGNWLMGSRILLKNQFELVDQAEPSFQLLAYKLDPGAPDPKFPNDWQARLERFGPGLTVVRSDQCPYLEDAVLTATRVAEEYGIDSRVVEMNSCEQVQVESPTPYGVFQLVLDGSLLSYHYLLEKDIRQRLEEMGYNRK